MPWVKCFFHFNLSSVNVKFCDFLQFACMQIIYIYMCIFVFYNPYKVIKSLVTGYFIFMLEMCGLYEIWHNLYKIRNVLGPL